MKLKTQRLLHKSKMLLTMLLIASAISGCQHAPKAPVIDIYLHDAPKAVAYCSRTDHTKCDAVAIPQTDNWFLLPPWSLEAMQNYIDLLVCKIEGGCKDANSVSPTSVSVSPEDLKKISKQIAKLRTSLESQRSDNEN